MAHESISVGKTLGDPSIRKAAYEKITARSGLSRVTDLELDQCCDVTTT